MVNIPTLLAIPSWKYYFTVKSFVIFEKLSSFTVFIATAIINQAKFKFPIKSGEFWKS